ncbi:MAG: fibrobacter succinogenes major paralogous domain-containing protein, partial [Bacteroidetes bacterium]|nr:fibrobacter succinogenes major paralogous domain-containing protein [Bacteroidota bacterium]
ADDYGKPSSGCNIQISRKGYNGGVWMGHENVGLNLNEMSSESEWTWGEIEPSTNLYYGGSSPRNINVVSVPFNVTFWVRIPLSAGQEISIKATKSGYKSAVRTLRLTTNMIMEIDTKEIGLYYEVNLRRNKTQNRSSDNQKNNSGYGSDKKAKKKFVKIGESHPTIIRPDMGSFVDKRDGKVYKTVKIGSQVWMAENLNVDKFRNGDAIPHAKTNEEWEKAGKNGEPAWCYYDNDPANGEKYGKLYNWYVVKDQRGLAPEGWHTPSDKEWTTLTDYLGGKDAAGKKMKSTSGWEDDGNGTNESGFSGLPGGYRGYDGTVVENIGSYGYWWSTTASTSTRAWIRCLNSYYLGVSRGPVAQNKRFGFSVRLVRD